MQNIVNKGGRGLKNWNVNVNCEWSLIQGQESMIFHDKWGEGSKISKILSSY